MRWEYNAKEAKWMSAHLQFSKGLAAIAPRSMSINSNHANHIHNIWYRFQKLWNIL